jgi:hypothetical protein
VEQQGTPSTAGMPKPVETSLAIQGGRQKKEKIYINRRADIARDNWNMRGHQQQGRRNRLKQH